MLLAARCAACGASGPSPCSSCRGLLRPPAPEPDPPGLPGLVAVLRYDGPARGLVARVKYGNHRQALGWLGEALAVQVEARLTEQGARHPSVPVVVTWAPTTDAHRRARGFDHGELLARLVARRLEAPCLGLLRRQRGPAQTGRPEHQRRAGGPSFSIRRLPPPGAVVVLIDDVVTTGATLRGAVRALRGVGAGTVIPAALARTPRHAPSMAVASGCPIRTFVPS